MKVGDRVVYWPIQQVMEIVEISDRGFCALVRPDGQKCATALCWLALVPETGQNLHPHKVISKVTQHAGTIEDYLRRMTGETWLGENTEHVLEHIRQIEAAYLKLLAEVQK